MSRANIQGEKLCVAKMMNIWDLWDEEKAAKCNGKSVKDLLMDWAVTHSDEYDEEYYNLIMTENIRNGLSDVVMTLDFMSRIFNTDKARNASLKILYKQYSDARDSLLIDLVPSGDIFKQSMSILDVKYEKAKQCRIETIEYELFKDNYITDSFVNYCNVIRAYQNKKNKNDMRIKKAELEKQRAEYLNEKLRLDISGFILAHK